MAEQPTGTDTNQQPLQTEELVDGSVTQTETPDAAATVATATTDTPDASTTETVAEKTQNPLSLLGEHISNSIDMSTLMTGSFMDIIGPLIAGILKIFGIDIAAEDLTTSVRETAPTVAKAAAAEKPDAAADNNFIGELPDDMTVQESTANIDLSTMGSVMVQTIDPEWGGLTDVSVMNSEQIAAIVGEDPTAYVVNDSGGNITGFMLGDPDGAHIFIPPAGEEGMKPELAAEIANNIKPDEPLGPSADPNLALNNLPDNEMNMDSLGPGGMAAA